MQTHWDQVYRTKASTQVSWYRPHLERSLELIAQGGPCTARVIDVGGGASTLVDDLLDRGYENVTVLDISEAAIEVARERLGARAGRVNWVCADVTQTRFAADSFDVWHDRAVFHFLTDAPARQAYVNTVMESVRPGGHVIVSTFGPQGPKKCSGLDVMRYGAEELHGEFGRRFELLESSEELHETPFGTTQQFLYCFCRLER